MAIVYKLINNNIVNDKGTTLTLSDGTGRYDATTNPGGYDQTVVANARYNKAVFILGLNKTVKGDKQITVTSADVTAITTTQYIASIPADGWYEFQMIVIETYDSSKLSEYSSGDFYYNISTQEIYKIIDDLRSDGFVYNAFRVASLLELKDHPIYLQLKSQSFFTAYNSKIKLLINAKISDMLINNVDFLNKKLLRQKDNYNAVRAILQGAIYEYMRSNKFVAQANIEFLTSNDYLKD